MMRLYITINDNIVISPKSNSICMYVLCKEVSTKFKNLREQFMKVCELFTKCIKINRVLYE